MPHTIATLRALAGHWIQAGMTEISCPFFQASLLRRSHKSKVEKVRVETTSKCD